MLSHSYSDGQEILRIMNMMSIYSTVRLGLNIVRHYAEIGSANSPLVIFFFFLYSNTILQVGQDQNVPSTLGTQIGTGTATSPHGGKQDVLLESRNETTYFRKANIQIKKNHEWHLH